MLSDVIGGRVAELRQARGWSRKKLSDELSATGLPMSEPILINIETRRAKGSTGPRQVTLDEFLAFAHVFGVPPVLLLFPVGKEAETFVGPDQDETAPTWDAYKWFIGEEPHPNSLITPAHIGRSISERFEDDPRAAPITLYRRHEQDTEALRLALLGLPRLQDLNAGAALHKLVHPLPKTTSELPQEARDWLTAALKADPAAAERLSNEVDVMQQTRREMRRLDLLLPPAPAILAEMEARQHE